MATAIQVLHVCAAVCPAEAEAGAHSLARELAEAGLHVRVHDLGGCFAAQTDAGYGGVDAALSRALEVIDTLHDPLVVTHASLPASLEPMGLEVQYRLAAAIGAGVVVLGPGEPTAAQSLVELAAVHAAEVVGLRGPKGEWRTWGTGPASLTTSQTDRLPMKTIGANQGVAETLRSMDGASGLTVPADRADILVGLTLALATDHFPAPARIEVQGTPAPALVKLLQEYAPTVPLSTAAHPHGTGQPALQVVERDRRRRELGRGMTPLRFTRSLVRRAQEHHSHIVLPEGEEPRVVRAAGEVLRLRAARLTLLGRADEVARIARDEGVDLAEADVIDPATSPLRARFAQEYADVRAKKGVTLDQAHERVGDVSYFGTMMVHDDLADGMVSGAVHTTAHTIRPAFEIIKTRPGATVVSSVFFMCLREQVLVFADCAVNPNPSADELADIAHTSALTARQFSIEPRVALLSYSTGTSGTGPDVDLVMKACQLVSERHPELRCDGPLQFDAATVPSVAQTKAPGSEVAGRANVLVFPDLSAGNIAYKAVQRTAGALAIGPVLQGLNKPVNDLSRGALVPDIVNTILVTAVQAGQS